jgi:phage terminase large subunit GpA-like protein
MGAKIRDMGAEGNQRRYAFYCPGCGYEHNVQVPRWTWNGSFDKPTFVPSLHYNEGHPEYCCHSFVKDGKIQFLNDCCHVLKGQTVEIPDWDS